jgi:hypothetical protein
MELLTQNSKIKKSEKRTFNFGIPAYQDAEGRKTCPNAAACVIGCYATAGAYRFSNVAKVYQWRLEETLKDSFVLKMVSEIKKKKVQRVRIHDSGDFYLTDKYGHLNKTQAFNTYTHYIAKWISIMLLCKDVEFYAYTKMVSIFKQYQSKGALPKNFILIYSQGGTQDKLINTSVDRHSRVFESKAELKASHYVDTSENDDNALTPNFRVGLVYHGTKKYSNTHWERVK